MANSINNLMIDEGDAIYYDPTFRPVLEDHMPYLRNHPATMVASITPGDAYLYRNDLFGLLGSPGFLISPYLHWIIMRMNNYMSPTDFTGETLLLAIPDTREISRIKQAYSAGDRIS